MSASARGMETAGAQQAADATSDMSTRCTAGILAALVAALAALLSLSACEMMVGQTMPPAPESRSDFVSLPFQKLINPAYTDEVSGKWVKTTAYFGMIMTNVGDLPARYRADHIRIALTRGFGGVDMTTWVVVPKEKSQLVFELQMYELVDVFAYLQPVTLTNAQTARSYQSVLFVVEDIRRAEESSSP